MSEGPGIIRSAVIGLATLGLFLRPAAGQTTVPATSPAASPTGVPTTQPIKIGESEIVFSEHGPHTNPKELARRFTHFKLTDIPDFDLSKYPYVMFVPQAPDEKTGQYGVLVDIADKPADATPSSLHPLLEKLHLICIVPRQSDLQPWHRAALAMDAAFNIQRLVPIDPRRVYLMGYNHFNLIALLTPDVFTGNISVLGGTYYRRISARMPSGHMEIWRPADDKPPLDLWALDLRRGQVRTTVADEGLRSYYQGSINEQMKVDGFEHLYALDVVRDDTNFPDTSPDWLEKALNFLDSVSAAEAQKQKVAEAPMTEAQKSAAAQALLTLAKSYLDNGLKDRAREKLNLLLEKYPDEPAAAEGKKMLQQMDQP